MFSLHQPTPAEITSTLQKARNSAISYKATGNGFSRDHTRSQIGHGPQAFASAKAAMRQWLHFDLGWVRIANPEATITASQIVAVEAHTLGLWSLNCNRILSVIDEDIPGQPRRFGYTYGTTRLHVESGEEQFLLEQDPIGAVFYDLLAISRPRHWLARLGYPYTRSQQRRFARDSHRRMARLVLESPTKPS